MPTTSSVTTTATSQLVTALGGGTGIDMAALAQNLAAAQFAAKADRLTSQSDKLDREISSASAIKSMLVNLSASLGERVRNGDLSPQPVVANNAVAKGTLSGAARPKGSYSLEVTALAAAQTLTSPAFAAPASAVGSGTLTLRFGTLSGASFTEDTAHAAAAIAIPPGATLADVASAINFANAGVSAYVARTTSGAQLVLKGQTGAANGFVLDASETPGDPGLAALAWDPAGDAMRLKAGAGDAAYKIDGLAMTSPGNAITDAIPGLNLALTATNAGAPTQITFADPASGITAAMQELVSALNQLSATVKTAADPKSGELGQDPGARALQHALAQFGSQVIMPTATGNEPKTLAELGLATQRDGSFHLDGVRLTAALKADPAGVSAMFTNGLYGIFASFDGIARGAASASNAGSLGGSIARYTTLKTRTAEDQTALTAKQETLRSQLVSRFAKLNAGVGASRSTLSFLQNQIAAWNAKN